MASPRKGFRLWGFCGGSAVVTGRAESWISSNSAVRAKTPVEHEQDQPLSKAPPAGSNQPGAAGSRGDDDLVLTARGGLSAPDASSCAQECPAVPPSGAPPEETAAAPVGSPIAQPAVVGMKGASAAAAMDVAPRGPQAQRKQSPSPVPYRQSPSPVPLRQSPSPVPPSPHSRPSSRPASRSSPYPQLTPERSRPSSRSSPFPQPTPELQAAMKSLACGQPMDAITDMSVIRKASVHNKDSLAGQLGTVIELLLRVMRGPRLAPARAAILTLNDLITNYGDAICPYCADDSTPTSSAVLALMQKATGADINSRRVAADSNAALMSMVEAISPMQCITMLENYATKGQGHIRAKAAALVVAAAYRLVTTDANNSFSSALQAKLLALCQALLADGGSACRTAAQQLAIIVHSAYQLTNAAEGAADGWADFLRLNATEAADAISECIAMQPEDQAAKLDGFKLGQPLEKVMSRLIMDNTE